MSKEGTNEVESDWQRLYNTAYEVISERLGRPPTLEEMTDIYVEALKDIKECQRATQLDEEEEKVE